MTREKIRVPSVENERVSERSLALIEISWPHLIKEFLFIYRIFDT